MTKSEAIGLIADSEEELGDTLLKLAATYWLEEGCSDEEIEALMGEVLEEARAQE